VAFFLIICLASILTFFPASLLALYVAFYPAFFLAYVSGISSDILSGILSNISSEILCGRGPAGNTLNLSLLFRSGGDHCDHELAVEARRRRRGMRRRTRPGQLT